MRDPIVIWVVDDEKASAHAASEVIQEIASHYQAAFGVPTVAWWANGFDWPPFEAMRPLPEFTVSGVNATRFPDIVVLDLMEETKSGYQFKGGRFYDALRVWEIQKNRKPSFVVVWSFYLGGRTAKAFVEKAITTDVNRLIPVPTKAASILRSRIMELYRRVIDERESL
jgi:hypothetical protein